MNPNNPLNVGRAKARQVGLSPDLLHLKHIFADKELDKAAVTEDSSVTAADGKRYRTNLYSLEDTIVADHFVGINKTIAMPKKAKKAVPDLMFINNQFSKFPGVIP